MMDRAASAGAGAGSGVGPAGSTSLVSAHSVGVGEAVTGPADEASCRSVGAATALDTRGLAASATSATIVAIAARITRVRPREDGWTWRLLGLSTSGVTLRNVLHDRLCDK